MALKAHNIYNGLSFATAAASGEDEGAVEEEGPVQMEDNFELNQRKQEQVQKQESEWGKGQKQVSEQKQF